MNLLWVYDQDMRLRCIEIVTDGLTRIVGNLYMQIFIQHRGGGNY